jgi:hypothetical protein
MRSCDLCGNKIPRSKSIDGKVRNLANRRYCLDCSPFGAHNTRRLETTVSEGRKLQCKHCGRPYQYGRYNRNRSHCPTCVTATKRQNLKRKMLAYAGGACQLCRYDKCDGALTFHHLDPATKTFQLSRAYVHSWENIILEMHKCVLVCNRCHTEIEHGLVDAERLESLRLGTLGA